MRILVTLFRFACCGNGSLECIKMLLEGGADLEATDIKGECNVVI